MADGKHVHEHVDLHIDSDAVSGDPGASAEEQLRTVLEALADEDAEITIETHSEEVN